MGDIAAGIDRPGALSIVVQGDCGPASADAVTANCGHWRRLFPGAQIICAISSGRTPRLLSSRLKAVCDLILMAPRAAPLPPMKTDSPGPNHVNLMIAAARAGLAAATGERVLRIRNDLIFRDRSFVEHFEAGQAAPRGDRSVFTERMLIAEVFTLNPVAVQRLPFHYSDWFHFGRTGDVRALWEAASPITLPDAAYYDRHRHRPGSTREERRFRARLAPEQVISFPLFADAFPGSALTQHNDPSSIPDSLLILADNFILADLNACRATIPKYQHVVNQMSVDTRLECLSQTLLDRRIANRTLPAARLYADIVRATKRRRALGRRIARSARRLANRVRQWLSRRTQ